MGDADLLRAARRDPEAFCRFYERHAVTLRGWLRGQTGSREVANDLTAETFAQALVALRRFRGTGDDTAVAWLYAIARHPLYEYRRRDRVETSARQRLGMPVRDYGEFETVEELEDARLLAPALAEAVARSLPASGRRSSCGSSTGCRTTRSRRGWRSRCLPPGSASPGPYARSVND